MEKSNRVRAWVSRTNYRCLSGQTLVILGFPNNYSVGHRKFKSAASHTVQHNQSNNRNPGSLIAQRQPVIASEAAFLKCQRPLSLGLSSPINMDISQNLAMQPRQFCLTLFCCYFLCPIFIFLLDILTLKWSDTQAGFSSTCFLCLEEGGGDIKTEKGVRRSDGKRKKEVGKCGS